MSVGFLSKDIRSAAILTNSFVAATVFTVDTYSYPHSGRKNEMFLEANFTIGSLNWGEIKIEVSTDGGTTYSQSTTLGSPSAGYTSAALDVIKLPATGHYQITIPFVGDHIKISAKGDGTVTGSSLSLRLTLAVV